MRRGTTVRKASPDGEAQLIERIARAVPSVRSAREGGQNPGKVRLGIGDDAAVLAQGGRADWVLSCDAFLEGVHFLADRHPPDSVGYKALARATSDLAAMGARPRFFLLALALPSSRAGKWLDEFLRGMGRAARQLDIQLAGGDTTKNPSVSMSITVIGEIARGRAIRRSGAHPGDVICVTGTLGRAELGLQIIKLSAQKQVKSALKRQFRLLRPHLYPKIRVDLGAWLASHRVASAMMDLSDGLSTDLASLCAASRIGARIWADRIPRVALPRASSRNANTRQIRKLKIDPLAMALHGGEDYELLFTVPRRIVERLQSAPEFSEITPIGEIERGRQILLVGGDGKAMPLVPRGWDPFRRG